MELFTQRLQIRSLALEDWQQLQKIFIDFAQSPSAPYDHALPTDDQGVIALTNHVLEQGLFFPVFLRGTSEMIGYVCFHKSGEEYDLGYCFHSSFHHQGYARESVKALLQWLSQTQGAAHFTAGTALKNHSSRRLLEQLGFALVSTETLCFHKNHPFTGGRFKLDDLSSLDMI